MIRRTASKKDACQPAIEDALLRMGASIIDLSPLGGGVPDLLVWFRGEMHLIECKDQEKIRRQNRALTDAQESWWHRWPGVVHLCSTPEEAFNALVRGNPAGKAQ